MVGRVGIEPATIRSIVRVVFRSNVLMQQLFWRDTASYLIKPSRGHVTKGNVFEDLGFSRAEATDLAMKVDLARDLRKFIERQKLTQESYRESASSTLFACWRRPAEG